MTDRKRVLIVEDAASMRGVIKAIIASLGNFDLVEAGDGEQALRQIGNSRFSLVVCDWDMPKVSGLEVLRAVRNQEKLKNLPFVMLTANDQHDKIKQAIALGVSDYIVKPFKPITLTEKISALLNPEKD